MIPIQTFITASGPSFGVHNLDTKRLVKQLLECRQILTAIAGQSRGWANHPATKMWRQDPYGFLTYCRAVKVEMKRRNFAWEKNWDAILETAKSMCLWAEDASADWWTDPVQRDRIITTHRTSLYNKAPDLYPDFEYEANWMSQHRDSAVCCDRCNYFWPTHKEA